MKISTLIIVKNEEEMIAAAIKSSAWTDEVVVVDTGSTDKTVKIARKFGAKVFLYTEGKNFSDWRNYALKKTNSDWIFYLDTDERFTPELKKEIQVILKSKEIKHEVYAVPRRNFIFNKEFKHSGQWPDYQKRFFKKSSLKKWRGEVHEEPVYEGELSHLKNPLIHRKDLKLSEMVEKTNNWSAIEAKLMFEAKHPKMNVLRFFSAMGREFWLRMVRQTAFLDGSEGIIYALYQVFSRFVSYAKLWEMQIKDEK